MVQDIPHRDAGVTAQIVPIPWLVWVLQDIPHRDVVFTAQKVPIP